jgi:hypothetical protein
MLGLVIPAWLPRLLPWAGGCAAVLVILGAVWWIHHDGYQQATRDAEARDLKLRTELQADLRGVEQALSKRLAAIDAVTAETQAGIAQARTIIQPTILKELTRETRYSDPAAGISGGLRAAVDRARAAVACTTSPDGGSVCALPAAEAAPGQ